MDIGQKIDELRKEKNMLAKELAKKSGVTSMTLSNWRQGRTKPRPVTLKKVADVLGCDLDELLKLL